MLNINDFKLLKNEKIDGHDDYWFKVSGDSQKYLEKEYMEMCMVGIDEVVYSKDENQVGIKRIFPFNWDVIMPSDIELKNILTTLSNNI